MATGCLLGRCFYWRQLHINLTHSYSKEVSISSCFSLFFWRYQQCQACQDTPDNPAMWDKIIILSIIYLRHSKICPSFPIIFKYCVVLFISSWSFIPLLFFLQPFCSSSKFSFSMRQYISSEITPVSNFHISRRQVIGLKFSTEFSFTGSFWHSTVLLYVIQDGISIMSGCLPFWLHCFFTLSSLINTFCCSNFIISSFRSLNHLASLLCSFSTLHIPLQNVLLSSAFGISPLLLPVCPLNSM